MEYIKLRLRFTENKYIRDYVEIVYNVLNIYMEAETKFNSKDL